jgi:hypothetical protein
MYENRKMQKGKPKNFWMKSRMWEKKLLKLNQILNFADSKHEIILKR